MCQHPLHAFLQQLPKCEHHVHLEGTLTPALLFRLAAKNKIKLPTDDEAFASPEALAARYNSFTSLDDFLHYYFIGMSVLIDASDFEELAWDYFGHAARDGVHHAEVFFDPQAHLERGVTYDTVLSGFTAARARAAQSSSITSELICCFLRHLPVPDTLSAFRLDAVQRSFTDGQVIGIGLDSSEKGFPPELFTALYREAGARGLRLTAHAGEEGPASYIRSALDDLRVTRIDHGIRLAEDGELVARVAALAKNDDGDGETPTVLLTMCPMSNVFLRCVARVADLPVRAFLDAGVPFSLNSDDPAYFGGHYILDNYCAVQEAFDLSVQEWETVCANAIRGSWCGAARKGELRARLEEVVASWRADHAHD